MKEANRFDKAIRAVTLFTLACFLLYGLVVTVFPLLPFWIDEWLLIDNLKFKTAAELWQKLAHTQQFPRLYLTLIKWLGAACDYSYTSLRLPSFIVHGLGLAMLYRLSGRIFRNDALPRFLWIMLYVSYNTSIHYFVQLKQYTMEMALSLVGIWQLLNLVNRDAADGGKLRCWLLCAGFALGPFFSYTYPIVVAPIYLLAGVEWLKTRRLPLRNWLPLLLGVVLVAASYWLDVRHVLADPGMQDFWQDLIMKTFSLKMLFANTYMMFCSLGSGDLFGNILGVLGVAAFFYNTYVVVVARFAAKDETGLLLRYSVLLVWLVVALFIAGKLPLGTFRLNSFVVPAVALMVVNLLRKAAALHIWGRVFFGIMLLLFLAAAGNVFVTMAELGDAEHVKRRSIYAATDKAILQARQQNLPMLVTSAIAYPFDDRWPGDWILKTHPRYKVWQPLSVYALPAKDSLGAYLQRLPLKTGAVMLLEGDSCHKILF